MISHLGGSTIFPKFFHLDSLSFPRVRHWPQQSFVHDYLPHESSKQEDQGQNKCCFALDGLHLFLRFYLLMQTFRRSILTLDNAGILGPHYKSALHVLVLVAADDAAGESESTSLVSLK